MTEIHPVLVSNRKTGDIFEEKILGEKWIRWAYQDQRASWIEKLLFQNSFISSLLGKWFDSPFSKGKIKATIAELDIDSSEFADSIDSYRSFNDFFYRRLKTDARPFNHDQRDIMSPADGRILVFPTLENDQFMPIKAYPTSLQQLIPEKASLYQEGALAIIRLCPADYHRYHFPCDGMITDQAEIKGMYHSVNPIALARGIDVFGLNKRHYCQLQTEQAGEICFMEVGAFGVGGIVNHTLSGPVAKMDEKGYFKFGGSTVILIFEKDKIQFSPDLIENSQAGRETLVKLGETIATIP